MAVTRSIDVKAVREDMRGCHNLIHFNNAGASLMPKPVVDYLHHYLKKEEEMGGYETAADEAQALERFYSASAELINCKPTEIAFVENATRAWDMAFYAFKFSPGDKILTTYAEYGSNVIAYIQQANRYGVEVIFVPNDSFGQVDVQALIGLVDDRVKLISMSHIPTGGGLVNPAKEIGAIAKAAGIPFILDSCQGVGQIPIDVEEIGCDILCGTGRKYLRGPRGTGLLYVRESLIKQLEPPIIDQHAATLTSPTSYHLRDDAKRFETWEQNFAGKAALGVAIDYALTLGIENIRDRVYLLADTLRKKLADIAGVTVTDQGVEKCGIVTFMMDNIEPSTIKLACRENNINVTTSTGSGSLVSFQQRGLTELVRASVHYYNTDEEIEKFIRVIKHL